MFEDTTDRDKDRLREVRELDRAACSHEFQEQPGEPPVDVCPLCGEARE